jgi:hypothetical protein
VSRAKEQAFPNRDTSHPELTGLTTREYFAAHAPADPQLWFKPTMPMPRPKFPHWSSIQDEKVREDVRVAMDCGTDPETPEGTAFIEHQGEVGAAIDAWDSECERQRYIQWPATWADIQLAELAKPVVPPVNEALEVLRALVNAKHIDLGDLVYSVRESEGEGWDGPAVTAWSEAVTRARKLVQP